MNELSHNITAQLNDSLRSLALFIPELFLSGLFIVVLLTDLFFGRKSAWMCKVVACGGMLFVIAWDVFEYGLTGDGSQKMLFSDMLLLHHTAVSFKLIIDVLTVLLLLYFSWDHQLKTHSKGLSDLYTITIASVFGLHLMVMACNLLSIYLAIELVSIASYLMVAYRSENKLSSEAGLRYVLFGAASSAVMLYGISLLYGFAGTTSLFTSGFVTNLLKMNRLSVSFAITLVMVGVGFKLSFVPMHFWAPDVYEGSPTPVTAYLSTLPKIAAFALLINVLTPFIYFVRWTGFDFRLFLSIAGLLSMISGNFAAVMQSNIKRMLAYSSIGHTGFALMAIITFSAQGLSALTFYLAVYALANIGALMLASYLANVTGAEVVEDYKGLGYKLPAASVCFVVILISLTGLPVTAGFTGKVLVFSAVYDIYQQNHSTLLLLMMSTGALTTVVSLFYYIKIPLYLFLRKPDTHTELFQPIDMLLIIAIVISVLMVLIGIFPAYLTRWIGL